MALYPGPGSLKSIKCCLWVTVIDRIKNIFIFWAVVAEWLVSTPRTPEAPEVAGMIPCSSYHCSSSPLRSLWASLGLSSAGLKLIKKAAGLGCDIWISLAGRVVNYHYHFPFSVCSLVILIVWHCSLGVVFLLIKILASFQVFNVGRFDSGEERTDANLSLDTIAYNN